MEANVSPRESKTSAELNIASQFTSEQLSPVTTSLRFDKAPGGKGTPTGVPAGETRCLIYFFPACPSQNNSPLFKGTLR